MPAPITVHFWPTPNGHKVTIALEEMGLPYQVRLVDIGRGEQFHPDFLRIAPNNRMPAVEDPEGPDGEPIAIFESGAILQYLARKTGRFCGRSERERIAVDQWLMWQMGGRGAHGGAGSPLPPLCPRDGPAQVLPYAQGRYRDEVARLYGVLDRQLARTGGHVATDEFTIADMAVFPWAKGWERQEQTLDDKPHMARWLDACAARPGVARGMAVAAEARAPGPMSREEQAILFGRRQEV
jgi:GST-like protein